MRLWSCLVCGLLLAACGPPRGDPDGRPVAFVVDLDREYVRTLRSRQGAMVASAGVGVGSHGHSHAGVGIGFAFSSTEVDCYGIDDDWGEVVFGHELHWGENRFEIPLRQGRVLQLEVVVSGARSGRERLDERITIGETPEPIRLRLDARGPTLRSAAASAAPAESER